MTTHEENPRDKKKKVNKMGKDKKNKRI